MSSRRKKKETRQELAASISCLRMQTVTAGTRLEIQRISRYIEHQGRTRRQKIGEIDVQNLLTGAIEWTSFAKPLDPTNTIPNCEERASLVGSSVQLALCPPCLARPTNAYKLSKYGFLDA